jgi:hypothetical protein
MSPTSFLTRLAVSIAGAFALFLAFTFLIDPYGVSPLRLDIPRVNTVKPRRIDIDRQIKPIEVWRDQPRTVFLGTSRIHQSIDPAGLAGSPLSPAYNASVPAVSLTANLDYLNFYADNNPALRNVWVEIFLYNFVQDQERAPIHVRQVVGSAATLLASSDALWDSVVTLLRNLASNRPAPSIQSGGFVTMPEGHDAGAHFGRFSQGILELVPKPPARFGLRDSGFEAVRAMIEEGRRRNLDLRFIATPDHAYFDLFLNEIDAWPVVEEWLRRVTELTPVHSFSRPHGWTQEPVGPRMRYWNDPIHFSLPFGRAIVAFLAGRPSPDAPENFHVLLTPGNVAAHVEERRSAIRRWAEANPEFVERFRAAYRRWLRAHGQPTPPAPTPRILGAVEAERVRLGDEVFPIASRIGGSLERMAEDEDELEVFGWAADHLNNKPAQAILIAVGDAIVARAAPDGVRADIEAGIGSGVRPAGFSIRASLNLPGPSPKRIRVYALTADGKAVQIASSLPPGRFAVVERKTFGAN